MPRLCENCHQKEAVMKTWTNEECKFFQPKTMYDYFPEFQKYKEEKAKKDYIDMCKQKLLTLNPNHTNFTVDHANTSQICTQSFIKFESNLQDPKFRDNFFQWCSMMNLAQKSNTSTEDEDFVQYVTETIKFHHLPINCPLNNCQQVLSASFILSHILADHQLVFTIECCEVFNEKQAILLFDPKILKPGETFCLGILALPSQKCNGFLPPQYEKFKTHLPIMIMACWYNSSTNNNSKSINDSTFTYFNNNEIYNSSDTLILWLAMEEKLLNINYSLSILDKDMNCSLTAQLKVRSIYDSQDPKIFLKNDHYFMSLLYTNVRHLTKNFTDSIQLKLVLHKPEMITPLIVQDIKNSENKILNQYFEEYLSSYLSINAELLKKFSHKSDTKICDKLSKISMLPFNSNKKEQSSSLTINSNNSAIIEKKTNSTLNLLNHSSINNKKTKPLQYYSYQGNFMECFLQNQKNRFVQFNQSGNFQDTNNQDTVKSIYDQEHKQQSIDMIMQKVNLIKEKEKHNENRLHELYNRQSSSVKTNTPTNYMPHLKFPVLKTSIETDNHSDNDNYNNLESINEMMRKSLKLKVQARANKGLLAKTRTDTLYKNESAKLIKKVESKLISKKSINNINNTTRKVIVPTPSLTKLLLESYPDDSDTVIQLPLQKSTYNYTIANKNSNHLIDTRSTTKLLLQSKSKKKTITNNSENKQYQLPRKTNLSFTKLTDVYKHLEHNCVNNDNWNDMEMKNHFDYHELQTRDNFNLLKEKKENQIFAVNALNTFLNVPYEKDKYDQENEQSQIASKVLYNTNGKRTITLMAPSYTQPTKTSSTQITIEPIEKIDINNRKSTQILWLHPQYEPEVSKEETDPMSSKFINDNNTTNFIEKKFPNYILQQPNNSIIKLKNNEIQTDICFVKIFLQQLYKYLELHQKQTDENNLKNFVHYMSELSNDYSNCIIKMKTIRHFTKRLWYYFNKNHVNKLNSKCTFINYIRDLLKCFNDTNKIEMSEKEGGYIFFNDGELKEQILQSNLPPQLSFLFKKRLKKNKNCIYPKIASPLRRSNILKRFVKPPKNTNSLKRIFPNDLLNKYKKKIIETVNLVVSNTEVPELEFCKNVIEKETKMLLCEFQKILENQKLFYKEKFIKQLLKTKKRNKKRINLNNSNNNSNYKLLSNIYHNSNQRDNSADELKYVKDIEFSHCQPIKRLQMPHFKIQKEKPANALNKNNDQFLSNLHNKLSQWN